MYQPKSVSPSDLEDKYIITGGSNVGTSNDSVPGILWLWIPTTHVHTIQTVHLAIQIVADVFFQVFKFSNWYLHHGLQSIFFIELKTEWCCLRRGTSEGEMKLGFYWGEKSIIDHVVPFFYIWKLSFYAYMAGFPEGFFSGGSRNLSKSFLKCVWE